MGGEGEGGEADQDGGQDHGDQGAGEAEAQLCATSSSRMLPPSLACKETLSDKLPSHVLSIIILRLIFLSRLEGLLKSL